MSPLLSQHLGHSIFVCKSRMREGTNLIKGARLFVLAKANTLAAMKQNHDQPMYEMFKY